jgi:hypothetical protein
MELTSAVSANTFLVTPLQSSRIARSSLQRRHLFQLQGWTHVRKTANEWRVYRTRFLIRARQLSQSLVFVDALGREHRGRRGDYLMETSDGAQRIVPRQLFEDVYVSFDCAPQRVIVSSPASVDSPPESAAPNPQPPPHAALAHSACGKLRSRSAPQPLIA